MKDMPIKVAPEGYEFKPLEYGIRKADDITRSQRITAEIDKILSPIGEAGVRTRLLAGAIITTPYKIGKAFYEDPAGFFGAMVSPKAWVETGRYFYKGIRVGDPTVVGELVGTVVTSRLIGKAIKFVKLRLPKTTRTIVGAREIARVNGKSIFDIEAYTRVKEFFGKKRIVKTKGIFEAKPKGDLVFTRGRFESVLLGKKGKPTISEVVGFGKGKDVKAFGIDL